MSILALEIQDQFQYSYYLHKEIKVKKNDLKPWLKKIGVVGFLFFLAKGILWLVLGWLVLK